MNKLAISLASRGRPAQLVDTIRRSMANWTHPETRMWVMLDDDDEPSISAVGAAHFGECVVCDIQKREDTIAAKWNRILSVESDVYSVAADDDPYVTPGYDSLILDAAERLPDRIGMIYGHLANLSFTCSLSATREWCDILGYLQPEHFPYWFCDHWTDDLARITGRIAFSNHRTDQSRAGVTQEFREPGWWATFYDTCYLMRRVEAEKILAHANDPNAELLLANAPLVDQRSRILNESVRRQFVNVGARDTDERYRRVKDRACAIAREALTNTAMLRDEVAMFSRALFPPTEVPSIQRAFA